MTTTNTTAFSVSTGGITLNNGTLVLKGGVNATVPQFSTISFISDGANLFEIGRGF